MEHANERLVMDPNVGFEWNEDEKKNRWKSACN